MCTQYSLGFLPPAPASPASCDSATDLSGRVIGGQYRLLFPLARNARCTVYEAEHAEHGTHLAIKVLAPDAALVGRFLAEARAAALLHHENIAGVTEFGCDRWPDGAQMPFLALEPLIGESLAITLAIDGPLRWVRVLKIARQICRVLAVAHAKGVVHGGLTATCCYRSVRDDCEDFIKVLDFGAVDPYDGHPGYMADELLRHQPHDHRIDIHALGTLMYALLTGELPHVAAEDRGAPLPLRRTTPGLEIPDSLEEVIMRALAGDPDRRFPDADSMLAALAKVGPGVSRDVAWSRSADAGVTTRGEPASNDAPVPSSGRFLAVMRGGLTLGLASLAMRATWDLLP